MSLDTVIEGFVYGELSPLASGQISSNAYEQSARAMLNMVPDVRGPAVRRPGVRHVTTIDATMCKMFGFQYSPTSAFLAAFTDRKATIVSSLGRMHGTNLLLNGSFSAQELGWNPETSGGGKVTFKDHSVYLEPGAGSVHLRQVVNLKATTEYEMAIEGLFRGDTVFSIGSTYGANDLANLTLTGNYTYQKFSFTTKASGLAYIQISAPSWAVPVDTESRIDNLWLQQVIAPIADVTVTSPYTASQIKGLQAVRQPNSDSMVILHKDVAPQELKYDGTNWTLTAIAITAKPAWWVAGSFPTVLTFFQGRSIWAGFNASDKQETFMFSKSASYYDLTLGVQADDAFEFEIDRVGFIRWIIGTKSLLLGTENSEYKIVPTESDGVIKPGTIQIELQSTHGAGEVLPVLVGVETAFVSVDARAVRAMAYYWEDDGWVAEELSQGSEHITYPAVTELDIAINPEPVLWCTLANGSLAACSYHYKKGGGGANRSTRITGWHRHQLKWPVESLAVVQDSGASVPWIATLALVDGSYKIHIGPFCVNHPQYLDDATYFAQNAPFTKLTGLGYLEGEEIDVLSENATHAKMIVSGGEVNLAEPTQRVNVGLPYLSRLVTQPLYVSTKEGKYIEERGRWTEVFVYLLNSALPLIDGLRAEEHGARTRMGSAQRLITGYTNSTQLGWERDTVLTIEQDLPYPLTITHIAGKADK